MSIITPTVGRVVWYWPTEQDRKDMAVHGEGEPLAATIAYVHSDSMVNLSVIDHNGYIWSRTSVHLAQAGEAVPVSRYAQWPEREQGDSFKRLPVNVDLIQAINTLGWTAKELSNTVGDDARRVSRKILARLEQLLDADQPTTAVAPEHGSVVASDSSREAEQFERANVAFEVPEGLAPHQLRLVAERADLDARAERLRSFITGETFAGLPLDEQSRLYRQNMLMGELSAVLAERIAAF